VRAGPKRFMVGAQISAGRLIELLSLATALGPRLNGRKPDRIR
jgi:hypothetical protein